MSCKIINYAANCITDDNLIHIEYANFSHTNFSHEISRIDQRLEHTSTNFSHAQISVTQIQISVTQIFSHAKTVTQIKISVTHIIPVMQCTIQI